MMKKAVEILTVFILLMQCRSTTTINNSEEEKDSDLLSELIKQITDACPEPCQNNGICVHSDRGPMCICISPYFGITCNEDPCTKNPCRNGGKCQIERDGFVCLCKPPYRGENCTLEPCLPNPCENDGKCKISGDGFSCICKNPYFGDVCEFGPCAPNPCKNGGECEEDGKSFKCICESQFTGRTCEQSPCSPNPCQNDGKCSLTNDHDFKCTCNEPFSGKTCEIGPCSSNPCLNNGGCKEDGNTFSCKCVPPFKGKYCESGPCSSNPCYNNGKCRVTGLNFICECQPPYQGKQCEIRNHTELDISTTTTTDSMLIRNVTYQNITEFTDSYNWTSSESATDGNATMIIDRNSTDGLISTTVQQGFCETDSDCLNGGMCKKMSENERSCLCKPNFGGSRCEVNLACVGLEQSCRMINAVCVLIDNHAICECPNGTLYHRKSGLCEDICDPRKCLNGKCEIIGRTYKCNCDEGYTGTHCDEKERSHHENFVAWFTVIASINLFICILLIGMFCVVCHIKRFITTA